MPKYFSFKVAGYYLYFTSKCIIEAFHVHASDSKLTEESSAKFFVKDNGDTVIQNRNLYNKSRQVKWRIYGTCLQELYEGFKRAGM